MLPRAIHLFSENGAGAETECARPGDRRCRVRVVVHWPLVFRDHSGAISEATTHNLSSQGLYFYADAPFVPGEVLTGMLMVPAFNPEDSTQVVPVSCRLRTLRVEAMAGNRFGIACQIEEYHVHAVAAATQPGAPSPERS